MATAIKFLCQFSDLLISFSSPTLSLPTVQFLIAFISLYLSLPLLSQLLAGNPSSIIPPSTVFHYYPALRNFLPLLSHTQFSLYLFTFSLLSIFQLSIFYQPSSLISVAVADPEPKYGAFLPLPGSRISFFPDPGSNPYF
jgi:hypothetical protein